MHSQVVIYSGSQVDEQSDKQAVTLFSLQTGIQGGCQIASFQTQRWTFRKFDIDAVEQAVGDSRSFRQAVGVDTPVRHRRVVTSAGTVGFGDGEY